MNIVMFFGFVFRKKTDKISQVDSASLKLHNFIHNAFSGHLKSPHDGYFGGLFFFAMALLMAS